MSCLVWPNQNKIIHWDIKDPVKKIEAINNGKDNAEQRSLDSILNETYNIIYSKIDECTKNEK